MAIKWDGINSILSRIRNLAIIWKKMRTTPLFVQSNALLQKIPTTKAYIFFLLLYLSSTICVHYVTLYMLIYTMVWSGIEANCRQPCFNGIYLTKTNWSNYQKYFFFKLNRLNRKTAMVHMIYSWISVVSPNTMIHIKSIPGK